jgi:glycosyltransferase involved in cell wall biosynthesis
MDSPTISVVMSVLNGEAFLREAVESMLGQTFGDFEFIIINDGSTDTTPQILADYAKRDDRIRIFSQQKKGLVESLNRGIALSRSDYIARMDADDVSLPDRLQKQVNFLERHREVGLLSGAYEQIDAAGTVLGTIRFPLADSEIRAAMARINQMCHPAVMMRREVACAAGGYRKQLLDAEDYDLWLRMAEQTQLANLDDVILRYRVHPRQVSITNLTHQVWCALAASAAASLRRRGCRDPLAEVREIDLAFVTSLGVTEAQVQVFLVDWYRYCIALAGRSDPELALRLIDDWRNHCGQGPLGRRTRADAYLEAAAIHCRRGQPGRAFLSAARGIFTRPMVAARPIRRALAQFVEAHTRAASP